MFLLLLLILVLLPPHPPQEEMPDPHCGSKHSSNGWAPPEVGRGGQLHQGLLGGSGRVSQPEGEELQGMRDGGGQNHTSTKGGSSSEEDLRFFSSQVNHFNIKTKSFGLWVTEGLLSSSATPEGLVSPAVPRSVCAGSQAPSEMGMFTMSPDFCLFVAVLLPELFSGPGESSASFFSSLTCFYALHFEGFHGFHVLQKKIKSGSA